MRNVDKMIRDRKDGKTLYWKQNELDMIKSWMYLNGFNKKAIDKGMYLGVKHLLLT